MKPKGRWIERYNSEFEDKHIAQTVLSNTSDILKLNVKPKDLWFIQHVLAQYIDLEEGEIFSDDSDDKGNENRNLNYYERNPVMTRCNETINSTKMTKHRTDFNDTTERRNYYDNNYGQNIWKVTNRNKYLPKHFRKYHRGSQTHCRKPFNERLWNSSSSTNHYKYY